MADEVAAEATEAAHGEEGAERLALQRRILQRAQRGTADLLNPATVGVPLLHGSGIDEPPRLTFQCPGHSLREDVQRGERAPCHRNTDLLVMEFLPRLSLSNAERLPVAHHGHSQAAVEAQRRVVTEPDYNYYNDQRVGF